MTLPSFSPGPEHYLRLWGLAAVVALVVAFAVPMPEWISTFLAAFGASAIASVVTSEVLRGPSIDRRDTDN